MLFRREVQEEAGYHNTYNLIPLYVYTNGTFKYYNYVAEVEFEFDPIINWETSTYGWFELHELPTPLHFGWDSLLTDPACMATLYDLVSRD